MPAYSYRAVNPMGRSVRGQLSARSGSELAYLVGEMGLELVQYSEHRPSPIAQLFSSGIETRELIRVFDLLHRMTKAGVPLRDAVGDARDSTQNYVMRDTLSEVYRSLGDGMSLSDALAKHKRVFNFICVTLVGVGEQSGRLDDALARLRDYLSWSADMVKRTKKALRYPTFVALMVVGVTSFMMLFVVPQVVTFLESNNQELPPLTVALIVTSEAFTGYWWAIFGIPVISAVVIALGRARDPKIRQRFDAFLLVVPFFGPVNRCLCLARFFQVMAIMYRAGVPILQAIKTAIPTAQNLAIVNVLQFVVARIEAGMPLSRALQSTGEFDQSAIRLVQLGEATGELDEMLARIASDLNESADDAIQSMIAKIEPGMTLLLGGMMAWIALAVFGPIYDSISAADF